MGSAERRKGATGEREVCHILTDELGEKVTRRINQARDSGCDIEVGAYNIEVKRRVVSHRRGTEKSTGEEKEEVLAFGVAAALHAVPLHRRRFHFL